MYGEKYSNFSKNPDFLRIGTSEENKIKEGISERGNGFSQTWKAEKAKVNVRTHGMTLVTCCPCVFPTADLAPFPLTHMQAPQCSHSKSIKAMWEGVVCPSV